MKEIKDVKELLDEELDKVTGGAPVDNLAQYLVLLSQDKTLTDEQRAKIQINLAHYICYIRE